MKPVVGSPTRQTLEAADELIEAPPRPLLLRAVQLHLSAVLQVRAYSCIFAWLPFYKPTSDLYTI